MSRLSIFACAAVALGALAALGSARAEQGADFTPIHRVLTSPRCQNCHPAGDAPRVGDERRPHRMNISRKSAESGLPCTTCHRSRNAPFEHGPPGVPGWQMPPGDHPMPFEGKSPRELCEQVKDPKRNGGKTLADLEAHFAKDPIVLWAWDPGPGRALPPLSHQALVSAVHAWVQRGAPCP